MARQQVQNLATTDPARALSMARTVADPWFRCQALAQEVFDRLHVVVGARFDRLDRLRVGVRKRRNERVELA